MRDRSQIGLSIPPGMAVAYDVCDLEWVAVQLISWAPGLGSVAWPQDVDVCFWLFCQVDSDGIPITGVGVGGDEANRIVRISSGTHCTHFLIPSLQAGCNVLAGPHKFLAVSYRLPTSSITSTASFNISVTLYSKEKNGPPF